MIIFLANIGNRDIKDSLGEIKRCRTQGWEFLDRYPGNKDQLTFPILEKGITFVFDELEIGEIDEIVLFYTDQDKKAGEQRERDTIYFANLLEKLLPDRFPNILNIRCEKIKGNPVNTDTLFPFYDNFFRQYCSEQTVERAILSSAGGIPACNMTMIIQGIKNLSEKSEILFVPEKEKPRVLDLTMTILNDYHRQLCLGLLERYDFAGLTQVMEQRDVGTQFGYHLACYFRDRLIMNYGSASAQLDRTINLFDNLYNDVKKSFQSLFPNDKWKTLNDFLDDLGTDVNFFFTTIQRPTMSETQQLSPERQEVMWQVWFEKSRVRIAELWLNAWVKWHTGEFTDFLGRLYRLNEAMLHFIFEKETRYSIKKNGKGFPDFECYLSNEGKSFCEFLENEGMKFDGPNVPVLKKFLTFLVRKEGKEDYRPLKKLIDKIGDTNGILKLRNNTIIAHGYASVDRTKIDEEYSGDILGDVKQVLDLSGVKDATIVVTLIKQIIEIDLMF